MHLSHRRGRVLAASLAALATGVALLIAPPHPAAATPKPVNPSDKQINAAQALKNNLATMVGQLSAQQASLQTQLAQAQARQELAEQKLAYALELLDEAKQNAVQAKQNAAVAQQKVETAQQQFVSYAQAEYMSGTIGGTTGTLLTADDPNVLLQQGALEHYQSTHQIGAIDDLQRAKVGKSNADAAARKAVADQTAATKAATDAKTAAVQAVQSTQSQQQQVQQALSANETKLSAARSQLATLNNQRAQYNAWVKEQERIAAQKRAEAAARKRAAELARQRAQQSQHSGGGGGGGGGSSWSSTPSPSGGSWSSGRGDNAVSRAKQFLGWMYAWAGGNANGPTYGVCAGDGAWNDCNVRGFDCSGLVMYAWGPYIRLAHYAATQYTQAGSYHPSPGNFRPGDLLFWSSDGTIGGIHHVAIYVGGGNVIQAPESGEVIQITPWNQVSWGYFGATRPLT